MYEFKTFKEMEASIDKSQPVFLDTESPGLYQKFRLLQVYQEGWEKVTFVEWPEPFEVAMFIKTHYTIYHNSHYDLTAVQQNTTPNFLPENFEDTFLLARLAIPNIESYSLDSVMGYVLGFDPYDKVNKDKKALQKSDWSKPKLDEDQLLYAAIDVFYMPDVWNHVKHKVDDMNYQLDKFTVQHCMWFQWNGMPVDETRLDQEVAKYTAKLAEINLPINANSYVQVRKWLNIEESDKKYLSKLSLRDGNTKAQAVLDTRSARKMLNFLDKYNVDRVIGKFKPSTRSGRLSSDDENLQQIPRKLKGIFGFPEDSDRVLIYSDYAQLELRTICAILGVTIMEELFRKGEDLHGYVASIIFGENWTKNDRQVTKTYNFNLLYGGSVAMVLSILITYGFWIEERDANRHKSKWLNLFREINKWQQESISAWRKGRLASTPLGRQYKGKLMTDQMNIMNQGAGAEVAKLALHYFRPWLDKFNDEHDTDVKLCNFIHDSYIIDCPKDPEIYEPVAKELARCMQLAWFEMSKLYKIHDLPMPVDVKVGRNWGDLEEDLNVDWEYQLKGMAMYDEANRE